MPYKLTKVLALSTFVLIFTACKTINLENVEEFRLASVSSTSYTYTMPKDKIKFVSIDTSITNSISKEDIELLSLLTMAEAEGESEEGKRLVIDTVLNRTDSEFFPDTIYDVIWQKNQFTSMWNGRIERCKIRDDIYQLVLEELEERTNYDVIFFNANHYSKYGSPLFKIGNHYFSAYE